MPSGVLWSAWAWMPVGSAPGAVIQPAANPAPHSAPKSTTMRASARHLGVPTGRVVSTISPLVATAFLPPLVPSTPGRYACGRHVESGKTLCVGLGVLAPSPAQPTRELDAGPHAELAGDPRGVGLDGLHADE